MIDGVGKFEEGSVLNVDNEGGRKDNEEKVEEVEGEILTGESAEEEVDEEGDEGGDGD